MPSRKKITERRAELAARQLLLDRKREEWMRKRMWENEGILQAYLAACGEEAAKVGRYSVREANGKVRVRELKGATGHEQLELPVWE